LTIRDEPVAAWELALQPGQDPTALGPEELYCFGVDSGNGSFFDAAAVDAVVPLIDRAIDQEKGDLTPEHKRFLDELRRECLGKLHGRIDTSAEYRRVPLRIRRWLLCDLDWSHLTCSPIASDRSLRDDDVNKGN
jgi:Protein of unknown function (DUF4241)